MQAHEALVTIATFQTTLEASLARGALEAIGIPASVPTELFGPFSSVQGRSWAAQLQVFESDRDRAIVELGRMQSRLVEPPGADER